MGSLARVPLAEPPAGRPLPAIRPTDPSELLIRKVSQGLELARSPEDFKCARDAAATAADWIRRRNGAVEALWPLLEIKVRAERGLGEVILALPRSKGGRPKKNSSQLAKGFRNKTAVIKAASITLSDAHRFEKIARIPEKRFEQEVTRPGVTTQRMLRVAKEYDANGHPLPPPTADYIEGLIENAMDVLGGEGWSSGYQGREKSLHKAIHSALDLYKRKDFNRSEWWKVCAAMRFWGEVCYAFFRLRLALDDEDRQRERDSWQDAKAPRVRLKEDVPGP
jgi:hypothetical protein